jgi:hypothetical protein
VNHDDFTSEQFELTSHAKLAIMGDKLDPDEITKLLGAKPTFACKKGVTWEMVPGLPVVQPTGVWHLEVRDMHVTIYEPKINKVLDLVTNDLARWKKIASRFETVMLVGALITEENGGFFQLSPKTMRRLADRGITILAGVEDSEDDDK